jgi:hypothetical protein
MIRSCIQTLFKKNQPNEWNQSEEGYIYLTVKITRAEDQSLLAIKREFRGDSATDSQGWLWPATHG